MQPASKGRQAAIKRLFINIDFFIIIMLDDGMVEFVTGFVQFSGFHASSTRRTGVCRTRLNRKINGRQHSTISANTRNVSTNAHKCAC